MLCPAGFSSLESHFSTLFWGLGYWYLRSTKRFLAAFLLGPLFAFSSCVAIFKDDHGLTDLAQKNNDCYTEALIISGFVLLLAADTWILAKTNASAGGPVVRLKSRAKLDRAERRRRARDHGPRVKGTNGIV